MLNTAALGSRLAPASGSPERHRNRYRLLTEQKKGHYADIKMVYTLDIEMVMGECDIFMIINRKQIK
jgi:hypothetical protein